MKKEKETPKSPQALIHKVLNNNKNKLKSQQACTAERFFFQFQINQTKQKLRSQCPFNPQVFFNYKSIKGKKKKKTEISTSLYIRSALLINKVSFELLINQKRRKTKN
jgi:hypothetical protein